MRQNGQQTCKVCGRVDKYNFHVPDTVWLAIVPEQYRDLVVCLNCLDDFAFEKGIHYAQYIKKLYFVGRGNTVIKFIRSKETPPEIIQAISGHFSFRFEKAIAGFIQDTINQHGDITKQNKASLAKRITRQTIRIIEQSLNQR